MPPRVGATRRSLRSSAPSGYISGTYLCKGKSAAAMKNDWDFFDIVQGVSGELTSESCESEGFDPKKPLSQQS